ncbi:hypothetical protein K2173_019917 [Erythroxylum novogranatense]|uniref:ABC transporter domain-containing protein n=1 Tax=Erythroxylum novogranatense TaxID=1862640 RepID=A0AAV8U6N1_9ROSI|nr:hypothetical protein K2173_019917 [Erythroxylum novogranatense]
MSSLHYARTLNNYSEGIKTALEVETTHHTPGDGRETTEDQGVSLSWENLWVVLSKGNECTKAILKGLTGYALPGQMLAIMGPSGCGKSTLLDTLAGRLGTNTRQTGDVLINGRKQTLAYGRSAYVAQDDILLATLTVREAVYYSAQLQLPESMSKAEKKERAEMTIREMGLQEAMDTRVGGWGAKGLSGGQKRRLSICIEILTRPMLLFLDEPTSGLDSAASYYVMNRIARLGQKDGIRRTVIASIHQPSSDVFQLFDTLCLLSSGKTVYFGPASASSEFFASNGFPCPTLQNPSDHFLKTINKDFERDLEEGASNAMTTDEVILTLTNSFKSSENYQRVQAEVAEIRKLDRGGLQESKSHAGLIIQRTVLTQRSFVNMYRDPGYYSLRLAVYTAVALALATVFYDNGFHSYTLQGRVSLLMFVSSFLTFMAIGGFPSFLEDMKVFQRERLNGHYGATAYAIGNTLSSVPYLAMISIIPGGLAYFLPGLQKGWEHFLYFVTVLFACMMLVESLMMIVATIVPNFLMGIITGAGIQGLMILSGGFFRLPNDLPNPIWKYPMFYIAFHRYAYQGLFKNEFLGQTFPTQPQGTPTVITGEEFLRKQWQVEMGYSKWVDLAILIGMIVIYRVLFLVIIKTQEKVKPIIATFRSVPNICTG